MTAVASDFTAGFYPDVPEVDYHSGKFGPIEGSLSQSGAKLLLKAPALFKYRQENPEWKQVFDFGTAAHQKVLGKGAEIVVHEPDPKVKSPRSTNAWKDQQAEVRARGAALLLPDEYDRVCDMATELEKNSLAMELLTAGDQELTAYAPHEPTGVWRRVRFDHLSDDIGVDYKSAVTADPDELGRSFYKWGYHIQHAFYLDVARDLGHPIKAIAYVVQEKEPPYLVSVVELVPDAVQLGREKAAAALERYRDCMASGVWPGYQPDGVFTPISLPAYAYYERDAS